MNVVANAIYYNPVLALQQLQLQGRLQHFFATWFQVSRSSHSEAMCTHTIAYAQTAVPYPSGAVTNRLHRVLCS